MEEDIYKYKGGFSDPVTLALLGASAGFLDPRGGMQGGFQGAMQGLMAGRDMRRQDMMDKQSQAKLTRDLAARQQLSEIVQQHQGGNPAAISNAILATGNPDLMQYAQQFRAGMPKVKSVTKVMKDGQAFDRPIYDTGEFGELSDLPAAEKLMQSNLGGQQAYVDPFTGQVKQNYQRTMDEGERARLAQSAQQFGMSHGLAQQNAALARDNAAFARQQAMKPQFKDGYWVTPPNANNPQGSLIPTDLATAPKGSQAERARMSERIKNTLGDDTEQLIKEATGSFVGNIRDKSASAFGITTDPAKANATLKLRAATLAGNMPRFEGPQSDADRQYYLEMAGDLANPNKTTQEKLMALEELRRIHNLAGKDGVVNSGGGGSTDGWGELR